VRCSAAEHESAGILGFAPPSDGTPGVGALPHAQAPFGDTVSPPRVVAICLALSMLIALSQASGSDGSVPTQTRHGATTSPGCTNPDPGLVATSAAHTITVDGELHQYLLAAPKRDAKRPRPLVMEFHGFGTTANQFAELTGMTRSGPRQGFIVVTPQGPGSTWQLSGRGSDARYIDALLARVEESLCVDLLRVYAMGFSQGAAFTILYACAHPRQFAAISTVAVEFDLGCTDPLSITAFHGTSDPAVPYQNGATGLSLPGVKVRGTILNMGDWAHLDGCGAGPRTVWLGTDVKRSTWPRCSKGNEVVLYTVVAGGHTWPGSDRKDSVMYTTETVSATNLALSFFGRHDR